MELFDTSINLSPIQPEGEDRSVGFKLSVARKLFCDGSEDLEPSTTPPSPSSPPYKRVRQLRLSEEPSTPSSSSNQSWERLKRIRQRRSDALLGDSTLSNQDSMSKKPMDKESYEQLMIKYGNPYSLEVQTILENRYTPGDEDDVSLTVRAKRVKEINISRFNTEFVIIKSKTSNPSSLTCMKRLDGCIYSIKRLPILQGSDAEKRAMNEVYAHSALHHPHIVTYYSGWSENNAMLLQTEYCDGGTLRSVIDRNGPLDETELSYLLSHIADALDYIHSLNLCHINISPSSVNLCGRRSNPVPSDEDDCDNNNDYSGTWTYKLGNMSHVTRVTSPNVDLPVDSVYVPEELRLRDYAELAAADIYALGITVYEAGGGSLIELVPGDISLPNVSPQLNSLLQCMTHPNPSFRPTASAVRDHGRMSKPDLIRCIAMEEHKTQLLTKQVEIATRFLNQLKTKRRRRSPRNSTIERSMSTESCSNNSNNSMSLSLSSDSSGELSTESTLSVNSLPSRLSDKVPRQVLTRSMSANSIWNRQDNNEVVL